MDRPNWAMENGTIGESDFCQEFLLDKELAYMGGAFFTKEGRVSDISQLKREIYQKIHPYVYSGVARKVDNILGGAEAGVRQKSPAGRRGNYQSPANPVPVLYSPKLKKHCIPSLAGDQ